MRSYSGPPGGFVQPQAPIQAPPAQAPQARPAPTPAVIVSPVPAPAEPATGTCPHCGAGLPSPNAQYCPQCGDPIAETSATARIRRLLSNRYLVGALAVVFVLLIAGILLAGQGQGGVGGASAQAVGAGPIPSPTVTAVVIRNASSPTPAIGNRSAGPEAVNASVNVTPHVNETVAVIKTLSRYIQNAGGDPSQLRTPGLPVTPAPPSPVPTSASGSLGNLSWSGEGTYVTDPFALEAGTIYVQVNAGVLTMAQLRDVAGTAIGIATAGPQPSNTTVRVPAAGTYRLEVWPFGSGPWAVTISYVASPTAVPTVSPVTVTTAVPTANNTTEVPTTGTVSPAPTTSENLTTATTEPTTTVPTQAPTPTPTQESRSFSSNGTVATPSFHLNEGLAVFTYESSGTGPFSVTLVGSGETVIVSATEGPVARSSKGIVVPATGSYLLNVASTGTWEVSIA